MPVPSVPSSWACSCSSVAILCIFTVSTRYNEVEMREKGCRLQHYDGHLLKEFAFLSLGSGPGPETQHMLSGRIVDAFGKGKNPMATE